MINTILLIAYSKEHIYLQTYFCILSLLKVINKKKEKIVLYTDNPSYFESLNIEIIKLSPEIISDWKGKNCFNHRIKIKALMNCINIFHSKTILIDCDIFCLGEISSLFKTISKNNAIMHIRESMMISPMYIRLFEKYLEQSKNLIPRFEEYFMWNSGVVGIHPENIKILKKVLNLTDKYYKYYSGHVLEQFAFSYVFEKCLNIHPSDHIFFHYWSFKDEMMKLIYEFVTSTKDKTLMEKFKYIDDLDFHLSSGQILHSYFRTKTQNRFNLTNHY